MIRSLVVIAFVVALVCVARADDKDPVKEKLFAAKVAYDKEMQEFRKLAGEWFDKREESARKDGNKKLLDQIKEERKSFDEDGDLPKAAPAALRQKPLLAKKALEVAYDQAVKDYVKAKKDTEAAAVEAAWKEFKDAGKVDLLALVDPKTHAVTGEWKMTGMALVVASGDKLARLQLPYEPGEEYDLEVKCKRTAGNDGFSVGLVAGGRQVLAVTNAWPMFGYRSGLDSVDKKGAMDNATTVKGELLKSDVDYTFTYSVRSGKIDVALDGKAVTSFKGEFNRLSLFEGHGVPNKKVLFLFVGSNTSFQIDRIMVTPVKGKGTILK